MDTSLVEAFARGYDFPLDGFQREACEHVAQGRGVLVAAPTGAGKTVVGEFAVYIALHQHRKCFYTTPIKALSNQKYNDLVARHGAESVGLLTGDASINPEAPVVVMTTEVLRNMIYAQSSTLAHLGYVVMDEVHYLADRFRGAVWEEAILGLADSVQVVSLSATVSNAEEFGEWLAEVRGDTAIVVSEQRPVPLYQHVMAGRKLYDLFAEQDVSKGGVVAVNPELTQLAKDESRSQRDDARRPRGRSGSGKRVSTFGSGDFGGAAHRDHRERSHLVPRRAMVIERLQQANLLPAIFFIFSRAGCDTAVRHIVQDGVARLTDPREREAIEGILTRCREQLSDADLDALEYRQFAHALMHGVAAHHAGMLPAFKVAVEEAFVKGLVKVVFATETLALGINMPARSVVLEKLVKFNGEVHADITPGEFTQLTGRAGRRGIDTEGHAVVLWQPGMDPRAVAGLAARRTYPLRSSFKPTYNMAVNLVHTLGRDRARILLEQSFAQFQTDRSVVGLSRRIAGNRQEADRLWRQADCDRGDFRTYAGRRAEIAQLEADAARARKSDRRAETVSVLEALKPGDVIGVPAGKHQGWAVVVEPGNDKADGDPRPLVMTEERQVKRLSMVDFPVPPTVAGRMKLPKHANPRDGAGRRTIAAAFSAKLATLDTRPARYQPQAFAEDVAARISLKRMELKQHPCHGCPDRETHARFAEQALRLERDTEALQRQSHQRTNTIAVRFDRICSVLQALGYLGEDQRVTQAGTMLARIYNELDLVAAECIRAGIFDGLSAPELAAVLSSLVFESRGGEQRRPDRMPDRASEIAQSALRRIWHEISLLERDHKLENDRQPDIGFAEAAFVWASGESLASVLYRSDLTAGDFVRSTRLVIDLANQLADAAGPGRLRQTCQQVVLRMRRGVVASLAE